MAQNTSSGGAHDGVMSATVIPGIRAPAGTEDAGGSLETSPMAVGDPGAAAGLQLNGSAATNGPTTSWRKRKPSGGNADSNDSEAKGSPPGHSVKKIKLTQGDAEPNAQLRVTAGVPSNQDRSLPPEVWQHVFTFCPPKTLGSLMSVSKSFNIFLDPASSFRKEAHPSATPTALRPTEPNAIWQASRRLFWPQMPAPLRSKTELDMWRLACSHRCQECGRLHSRSHPPPPNPHHPGPGSEGVAAIWAFGSRMCAACLLKTSDKELDLLISPSIPSAIIPALPFVFLTPDCHVFSAIAAEQGLLPDGQQATKLFSKSDVEALQEEFLQVKDMGQGTVGEWLKGLAGRGSDLQHDAAKWEKWEASGGTMRMCSLLYPGYEKKGAIALPPKPSTNLVLTPLPAQGRHERTAEEAAELKTARKAEIERRALLLDPPLTADVLHHIPSFQAATQIVAQLDDDAWERLKPRLLAQRADAEKIFQIEREARSVVVKQEVQEPRPLETTLATEKEARDLIDKNWEEVQAPLRVSISGYADEVLRDSLGKGKKVTKENCSRFAVDSLLYVRKRFYDQVAKDAAAARAAGRFPAVDPPEGPFTQKLTLENMKWIFDTKFKPHTESLRKELFYCNGCEGNHKLFGFEGVIQHYAAKHTGALSLGSIVVHWRAEWPEHPPFSATPRTAKAPFHGAAPLPLSYNYPPAIGYGYTPPAYNDHFQHPHPHPPPHPYQPQPAPTPFLQQPGYEQQPSYATMATPYPAYQPPPMPYAPPAVEPTAAYVPPPHGQYDHHYGVLRGSNTSGPYPAPQLPPYSVLYQNKVDDIARNSREVWQVLSDVRDLPGDVKVFVTIHHLVKRFRSRFYETPLLSMFIDGLSNSKEMRPVRNVNGLVCKACHLELGNAASVEQDRRNFSLPQLANHFQSKHVEPMERMQPAPPPLDWVVNMVLVRDLAALPNLAVSANEPQKALLSAALPDAFARPPASATGQPSPQQESRQQEQVPVGRPTSHAADNGEATRAGASHSSHAGVAAPLAAVPFYNRIWDQSPHNTTPGTLSENERSTHSDGGRQSSHGSQPNHGQKASHAHKRPGGQNGRGRLQGSDGSGGRAFEAKSNAGSKNRRRDEADVHHMRAAIQAETVSMHASSDKPAQPGAAVGLQGRSPTPPTVRPSAQADTDQAAHFTRDGQEPNVMAALESYLEQSGSQQSQDPSRAQNTILYANGHDAETSRYFHAAPRMRYQYGYKEGPGRSSLPAVRSRSPTGRQVEPAYYFKPTAPERRGSAYGFQRAPVGFIEPSARHAEEERFGQSAPRPEDRGHYPAPPGADYRRYDEDGHMQSRPPVEAYEIVHVIDEHGEYYIRRPVRRDPEPRYMYEERRTPHDAGSYRAPEPHVYAPGPRANVARQGGQAGPELRPTTDRRADPAYYEEYDPRFPAA